MLRFGTYLICVVFGSSNCFAQSNGDRSEAYALDPGKQQIEMPVELLIRDVERLRTNDPTNAAALVDALTRLGFAQYSNNDLAAADITLTQAVSLAEERFGRGDVRLARPLEGLGLVALAREQYTSASEHLRRALTLVQRREGLLHAGQVELLDNLATAQTGARHYEEAEKTLQFLIQVQEKTFGRRDPRVLPSYTRLAEWYSYMGDLDTARLMLRRVLQMTESNYGPNAAELIRPLRALSRSYHVELVYGARVSGKFSDRELLRAQSGASSGRPTNVAPEALLHFRSSSPEGERAIVRAAAIAESTRDVGSTDAVVSTLLEAGDWFAFKKQLDESIRYYKRALAVAGENGKSEPVLNFPQPIFFPFIERRKDAPTNHYLTVEFSVRRDGTTGDIKILDGNASAEESKDIEKAIRVAKYRPRFVNGEPVDTNGLMYRHVFR